MCVIIAKNAGVPVPSIDIIRKAMIHNPDGFALGWCEGGKLKIYRTLDRAAMLEKFAAVVSENSPFVFHARIGTSGSKSLGNCHGWTTDTDEGRTAFFHNGILSIAARGDMTDSETFLRDIFEPAMRGGGYAGRVIDAVIGGSKFAWLSESGKIRLDGYYHDIKGVKYSNLYFLGGMQKERGSRYSYRWFEGMP